MGPEGASEVPAAEIEAARTELARVREEWLRRPDVTAVDVGFRRVGGRRTDEVCVRVHVTLKRPEETVPPEERFPSRLGRFPVDVVEASYGPEQGGPVGG